MSVDTTLPGGSHVATDKVVTTKVGDEGTTSLGIHGFIPKSDARVELMGGLDMLRSHLFGLAGRPHWLEMMITDMMLSMVRIHDIHHEDRLRDMEEAIVMLRENVAFSESGWFAPVNEQSQRWNLFRAQVRHVERNAWRVYNEHEKKERFKEMAQLLNRLSDYSFLIAMVQAQKTP